MWLVIWFNCRWNFTAFEIVSPLLRSLIMTMPALYPTAICMAFELGTYGFVAGYIYNKLPDKKTYVYVSLVSAMVAGRIIWGLVRLAIFQFDFDKFGWSAFWAGAVGNAIPGIIVQIILIPVIVMSIEKIRKK